jgi:hypothetical protein
MIDRLCFQMLSPAKVGCGGDQPPSRNRQPQEAASAQEIRHRNPSLLNL